MAPCAITLLFHVIRHIHEEDGVKDPESTEVTVEDLVEDISIDGMCGVY